MLSSFIGRATNSRALDQRAGDLGSGAGAGQLTDDECFQKAAFAALNWKIGEMAALYEQPRIYV
jgi:hypothetical protein